MLKYLKAILRALAREDAAIAEAEPWGEPFSYVNIAGRTVTMRVHRKGDCRLPDQCVVHNPSDHHMRSWPLEWRADRGLFERVCRHPWEPWTSVGHPDPDDIAFKRATMGDEFAYYEAVHGCDGCCTAGGAQPYRARPVEQA